MATTVTREHVNRYIKDAALVAQSETEQLALQTAVGLNAWPPKKFFAESLGTKFEESYSAFVHVPGSGPRIRNPRVIKRIEAAASTAGEEIQSWQKLILKEIRSAFCGRSRRYKKEVSVMKNSVDVLILAIAAAVAKAIGANIVVVAALVASLMRFVMSVGISVFCEKSKSGLVS